MRTTQSMLGTALLGLAASLPSQVSAQVGVSLRASTLGAGVEVSYRVNKNLGLRGGGNYLKITRDGSVEDVDYRITPRLQNLTAIADLHPTGGAFHLSAGLLLNQNEVRMVGVVNQNVDIGGTTYTPQQVGSLIGVLDFRKAAPYLGLGFGGRGKVSFLFDLGVGITGTPQVSLTGTTSMTGAAKAEFDANVAEEEAQIRSEIEGKSYLKFHPVLALGIRIGF